MKLSRLIKQTGFSSPGLKALLNITATESWQNNEFSKAVASYAVTRRQYNVLRILRGSHPAPLTCSSISERLVDRTPDVTRLLVRLEKENLISRNRADHDRRVVEVHITKKGLSLLTSLDEPVDSHIKSLTRNLTNKELATLSDLLERLRTDQRA